MVVAQRAPHGRRVGGRPIDGVSGRPMMTISKLKRWSINYLGRPAGRNRARKMWKPRYGSSATMAFTFDRLIG